MNQLHYIDTLCSVKNIAFFEDLCETYLKERKEIFLKI